MPGRIRRLVSQVWHKPTPAYQCTVWGLNFNGIWYTMGHNRKCQTKILRQWPTTAVGPVHHPVYITQSTR
jgi:hypothetical protein